MMVTAATVITLTVLIGLAQHGASDAAADMIAGAAVWLIALAAMVLIFTRQSNRYYRQAVQPAVNS
jgi:membrane-associated PAP2 superfamily phosphatase